MSPPTNRAAWWPVAVAVLLLALAGGWLAWVLPAGPRQLLPVATVSKAVVLPQFPAPVPAAPDTLAVSTARRTAEAARKREAAFMDSLEAATADACPPEPLRFSPLATALVFHRYTGTIDREQVTVELGWIRSDSMTGRFYRWRGGPEYRMGSTEQRHEPLVLPVHQSFDFGEAGTWQLIRMPGAVLTGIWVDTSGHRQPFQLRENYTGAVSYEIQAQQLTGGKPDTGYENDCNVPHFRQEYLHLLGAAGQRRVLRYLQPPPAAVRRRQLREKYEFDAQTECGVVVRLNDFNLLSYQATYFADPFGGKPQPGVKSFLIDLVTGRSLTIASQLRPDYELQLRRLLTKHLLQEYGPDEDWKWQQTDQPVSEQLVDLPLREHEVLTNEDFLLTGEGLEATYSKYNVYAHPGPVPPAYVLIPYRELRPLVRPGTPLARMLQARGMW